VTACKGPVLALGGTESDERPQDDLRAANARRRARRRARQDREHLGRVAGLPCLVCGRRAEVHHEPPRSKAGAWSDRLTVPLCADHHRGPRGRHGLGLAGFLDRWGIDLVEEAQRLSTLWDDDE
jgi:hypothetical protein